MKQKQLTRFAAVAALGLVGLGALAPAVLGHDEDVGRRFEIVVTNLTRGQQFPPILAASHRPQVRLFDLGAPAAPELQTLAEEGDTGPLAAALGATGHVLDIATSGGLLNPGASATLHVATKGRFDHVSVAAMLIPTNDGFFAVNGHPGPNGRQMVTLYSPAYDAGSERNDETCASIPGPFFAECGGAGGGGKPVGGEEGYVHIHAGIHGIGQLNAAARDWRNPVAQITIRRVL